MMEIYWTVVLIGAICSEF